MRPRRASIVTPAAAATSAISASERGRNSCSGGSSRRIVTGSPRHDAEQRSEIGALGRQQLCERGAAAVRIGGHDHLAHRDDAFVVEEHVFGATKADPFGAEAERRLGIARRLGVGADAQAPRIVRPAHERS